MQKIFISYAEEDHAIVKELAEHIERKKVKVWYYTRDGKIGPGWTEQVPRAISESHAFVLLATESSVVSKHITKEIENAYQRDKTLIPILHGTTRRFVIDQQPSWGQMLGTAVFGNTSHVDLETLATKIVEALPESIIDRDRPVRLEPWVSDGSEIEISRLKDVLFQTPEIQRFVESDHQFSSLRTKGLARQQSSVLRERN